VAHEASAEFAEALYARLPAMGAVEALADVQRAWIREARRPTHWAAYLVHVDGVEMGWARRWWTRARAWLRSRSSSP
jgi:hypothetical protein